MSPNQRPKLALASDSEMAQSRDSSGLLSLASLRERETRHAQQRSHAVRARAEAEQRARADAEREKLRTIEERQRLDRVTEVSAEAVQHAERLRLEAARTAEREQARIWARDADEQRLLLSAERESKRSAELAFTAQLLRQKMFTSLAAAACIGSWLAAVGLYFGVVAPRAERVLLTVQHSLAAEERALGEARVSGARLVQERAQLAQNIGSLEQSLRDARAVSATPPALHRGSLLGGRPVPPNSHHENAPCKDDGDPLEPCLKH